MKKKDKVYSIEEIRRFCKIAIDYGYEDLYRNRTKRLIYDIENDELTFIKEGEDLRRVKWGNLRKKKI